MPDENEDLLTLKEIGVMLKVSSRTVHRWDEEGLLPPPSFVCGSARRWSRALIRLWIAAGGTRQNVQNATSSVKPRQVAPKDDKGQKPS